MTTREMGKLDDKVEVSKAARRRYAKFSLHEVQSTLGRLSPVDVDVLQALLRYPFSRADDLAIARHISRATIYRHLLLHQQLGLVECVVSASLGSGISGLYHLSNLGLHALALHEKRGADQLAREWAASDQGLLGLLPRLDRLVSVQNCINGLVAYAPEALTLRGRRSECRWHWVRDFRRAFYYREKRSTCAADAELVLRVRYINEDGGFTEPQWYCLFLLLDVPLNQHEWMNQRLKRLLYYRESPERWSHYTSFPPVLVLTYNQHRQVHWQRAVREATKMMGVPLGAPLQGAIACLPAQPSGTPSDLWRLGWKTLAENASCHLQDLLKPLATEAIPPGPLDRDIARDDTGTARVTPSHTGAEEERAFSYSQVIVGHFMLRAEEWLHQGQARTPIDREGLAMLGLNLSRRHLLLQEVLLEHPLLAIDDLAAILAVSPGSTRAYLRDLAALDCVVAEELLGTDCWRLTDRGLRQVAAAHGVHISRIAAPREASNGGAGTELEQYGLEELRRHVEHFTGIYHFFATLARMASQRGHRDHRLLWWETGALAERRYLDNNHWYVLKPDGSGAYQGGERQVDFWLEWDRGTLVGRELATKFYRYARYVDYRAWAREQALLPHLLVVTASRQEKRLRRIAAYVLEKTPTLAVYTTVEPLLANYGPLAAIWKPIRRPGDGLAPGPDEEIGRLNILGGGRNA